MHHITRCILSIVLLAVSIATQANTLPSSGYALSFSSALGSTVSGHAAGGYFDAASLNSLNGIVLGTAQSTVPGIDQTWTSNQFHVSGNHYTSSSVNVLSSATLDFSGWVMRIGGENYAFGSQQGIANYSYDGLNFTLDYSWTSALNGGIALGSLGVTDYQLHLVGTAAPVPVPGAIWLLGSGLLGLLGVSRRSAVLDS